MTVDAASYADVDIYAEPAAEITAEADMSIAENTAEEVTVSADTDINASISEITYTENTDFNVPNVITNKDEDSTETQDIKKDDTTVREKITLNSEGEFTIVITYGENMDQDYKIADPVARFVGDAAVYTFTNDDVGEMRMSAKLKPGVYTLEITGLYGRTYEYNVYQKKEK